MYNSRFGLEIGVPSLCKNDAVGKLSRLRTQFITDVSLYNDDALIFIDETGCDCRNTISMDIESQGSLYDARSYSIKFSSQHARAKHRGGCHRGP